MYRIIGEVDSTFASRFILPYSVACLIRLIGCFKNYLLRISIKIFDGKDTSFSFESFRLSKAVQSRCPCYSIDKCVYSNANRSTISQLRTDLRPFHHRGKIRITKVGILFNEILILYVYRTLSSNFA